MRKTYSLKYYIIAYDFAKFILIWTNICICLSVRPKPNFKMNLCKGELFLPTYFLFDLQVSFCGYYVRLREQLVENFTTNSRIKSRQYYYLCIHRYRVVLLIIFLPLYCKKIGFLKSTSDTLISNCKIFEFNGRYPVLCFKLLELKFLIRNLGSFWFSELFTNYL